MNSKKEICLGTAGAGRAAELHLNALNRFTGIPICFHTIAARRFEQVDMMKNRYSFMNYTLRFEDLLETDEIDVIDICTPPYVHEQMIVDALNAGKHVICEKPLSGYFGRPGDPEPIGLHVSKSDMYARLLEDLDRLKEVVTHAK